MADCSGTALPKYPQGVDVLFGVNSSETPTRNTVSSESSVPCRICKLNTGTDLISSPCHCKGTLGRVHVACLEEWLTWSVRDSCELCSFPFTVVKTPKYGYVQSLRMFLNTTSFSKLLQQLLLLIVLLINACFIIYMWLMMNENTDRETPEVSHPLRTPLRRFFFNYVVILCLGFLSVGIFDHIRKTFYFYYLPWYHWRRSSVKVKLIVDLYK
ncbi:E3 ubiquitin-protein ligase MARCHF8-like [Macrosteles quadrilineatus]|uniref:E3 ubiquitin-protein ligase MARCHF8-like n=1 Tax=Macrosteles quadrilineatus TaxID=74068 RepID=UPI0023E0A452|nr:E3 ubiquitin-protein ligase MARCHF8-like [Macrosteles quadrilineatus]